MNPPADLPAIAHFHCGRCGALFPSPPGEDEKRRCPDCGAFSTAGLWEKSESLASPAALDSTDHVPRVKRLVRKRKGVPLAIKIVLGWVALTAVAALLIVWLRTSPSPPQANQNAAEKRPEISVADRNLLTKNAPVCAEILKRFLASQTVEDRAALVNQPGVSARMNAYYSRHFVPLPQAEEVHITDATVTTIGGRKAIETRLTGINRASRISLDAAFYLDEAGPSLDWDALVAYSPFPWSSFLAGSGPDESEFRLYARERLPENFRNSDTISLVFYQARIGRPDEVGSQSPEFLLKRDSPDGRLVEAALRLSARGENPFGSLMPTSNPEGLIRIRATIRRQRDGESQSFAIKKIHTCHWFQTDESGLPAAGETQAR